MGAGDRDAPEALRRRAMSVSSARAGISSTTPDRFEAARSVADAVLYEGNVLYPYRASARKNQLRWQFGVLAPRAFAEADGSEAWRMRAECVVESGRAPTRGSRSSPVPPAASTHRCQSEPIRRLAASALAGGRRAVVHVVGRVGRARGRPRAGAPRLADRTPGRRGCGTAGSARGGVRRGGPHRRLWRPRRTGPSGELADRR